MSSYGYRPSYCTRAGYSTGPAYSTGAGYSTGPGYSTGTGYTTGSNGVRPYTNDRGQTRYAETDEFRTTRVDAGTQPGSYVKHETIITEHIDSPLLTSNRHGSPPRGYAATGDNWSSRPLSPPRQTFEPARTYGGYPNQSGYNGPPGYGDYSDQYSTNKPYKHSNTARYDNYDDSHNRKQNGGAVGTAINMIANASGHGAKPNRGSLLAAARPARGDGRLSLPTDDMERALHYLKESAKPKDKYSYK